MSQEHLKRFQTQVLQSPALQERLKVASDVPHFVELAVQLGAENGLHFSAAEVEAFIAKTQESAKENELSDELLETVAGGSGTTYTVRTVTINGCTLETSSCPSTPPGPIVA